ncbi:MAG: Ig-like domain-containing protein, partial [Ignavibacteriales bacterium]|nr:Ig-like domain-containing protein [Ignavibacteriales bacterium]
DKDGIPLGETFSFSFRTAAFRVRYTSPANAQMYVPRSSAISLSFNNYVDKASVQTAFSISPGITGTIDYARDYNGIEILDRVIFSPASSLQANTKYTVSVSTAARDINGVAMKTPHSFAFVTRQ